MTRALTCPLFDRYFSKTMLTNSTAPSFRFINPMLAESSDVLADSLKKTWAHDDNNGMLPDYALLYAVAACAPRPTLLHGRSRGTREVLLAATS